MGTDRAHVRLAELVAALSLGIDLGFGQPMEHVLRQCLIALRLAERIELDGEQRSAVYYTSLLINVGCHTDAHEQAKWFGDDIAVKSNKYAYEFGSVRGAAAMIRSIGSGARTPLHRFRLGLEFALSGRREVDGMIAHHAAIARSLGEQLSLPADVLAALGGVYEQRDGRCGRDSRRAGHGRDVGSGDRRRAGACGGAVGRAIRARARRDRGIHRPQVSVRARPRARGRRPRHRGGGVRARARRRRSADRPAGRPRPRPRPTRGLEFDLGQAWAARRRRMGAGPAASAYHRADAPPVRRASAAWADRGRASRAAGRLRLPAGAERRRDHATGADHRFSDDSFDTVVATLVLCTVDDQPRALREARRVLRPGGRLLFIEHVRSDAEKLARLQDRMLPINVRFAHGCHCNRPTLDGIRGAGFRLDGLQRDTIAHAPPFVRPLIVGTATAPGTASTGASDQAVPSSTIS